MHVSDLHEEFREAYLHCTLCDPESCSCFFLTGSTLFLYGRGVFQSDCGAVLACWTTLKHDGYYTIGFLASFFHDPPFLLPSPPLLPGSRLDPVVRHLSMTNLRANQNNRGRTIFFVAFLFKSHSFVWDSCSCVLRDLRDCCCGRTASYCHIYMYYSSVLSLRDLWNCCCGHVSYYQCFFMFDGNNYYKQDNVYARMICHSTQCNEYL